MQKVIAARDVDIFINFDAIGFALKIETGSNITINIGGNTEDIGAISTDEPIAIDNGGNTYDIGLTLQESEANAIKDALAAATAASANGSVSHIRQIVEAATISIVWNKKRDIPPTSTVESYSYCTGVSEADSVERRSSETLKTWNFRSRVMSRKTVPIVI